MWGEKHLQYAVHLNNLAMLLHEMGQNAEAVELLQQTLQIRQAKLGDKHESVAQCLLNIGSIYYADQNLAAAGPLFRQALDIFESAGGGGQPLTRLARTNLGLTLLAERKFDEAEALLRTDLDWTKKEFGENRKEYAESLSRMVVLYGNQGRYNDALPLAEHAAQIQQFVAGPEDPQTHQAQLVLAKVRGKLNDKPAGDAAVKSMARPPDTAARRPLN